MSGRGGLLDLLCCFWLVSLLTPRQRPITNTHTIIVQGVDTQNEDARQRPVPMYLPTTAAAAPPPANALPLIACATMVRDKEGGESC